MQNSIKKPSCEDGLVELFTPTNYRFCSGFGQYHTNEFDPQKPEKKLTPYIQISFSELMALVDDPQQIDKREAQWIIPSNHLSRTFREQEAHGSYFLLWADIDKGNPEIEQVKTTLNQMGHFNYEIYTTSSATLKNLKYRILIFLSTPLTPTDWMTCQKILNDGLERGGLIVDRKSEGFAQLCYLPNRGEYYETSSKRESTFFDPLHQWHQEITQEALECAQVEVEIARKRAEAKARSESIRVFPGSSQNDLIGAFNNQYPVEEILVMAGYAQRGSTFRHLLSESGSYSASVKDGRVFTLSSSDRLYSTEGAHDAFSAFATLFHDGDINKALKDAGDHWLSIDGISFNLFNQRQYMADKERFDAAQDFNKALAAPKEGRNYSQELLAMRITKEIIQGIADTKFAWSTLIVQGHMIFICSEANGGKTTIMIHIAADLVRSGYKVIYINADAGAGDIKSYAEHAHLNGYELLNPDLTNKSAEDVMEILEGMSKSNEDFSKHVLFLDTLKKFGDLMNKKYIKKFNNTLRALTSKGMTVIGLSHTNKYKAENGEPIYEGTGDIRNDVDELIYLEPVKHEDGSMTVSTKIDKSRSKATNMSFKINSDRTVEVLDGYVNTSVQNLRQRQLAEDADIIQFIISQISFSKSKIELLKIAKDHDFSVSRRNLDKVLDRYSEGENALWKKIQAATFGYRYVQK